MAELGSLCKSSGILYLWNSSGSRVGILVKVQRKRPLDWHTSWFLSAKCYACDHNILHELGRTGLILPIVTNLFWLCSGLSYEFWLCCRQERQGRGSLSEDRYLKMDQSEGIVLAKCIREHA